MTALVLGATGHIGNAVVRALLARGHAVSALGRRPGPGANLADLPVRYVRGDLDDLALLDTWIAGHDLVIDAAAPYPLAAAAAADTEAAVRRMQALLASAARHRARLAHVSSFTTRAGARSHTWPARVARGLHPYFALKERVERLVCAAAARGLPAVIVNPTMCLGPWDLKPRALCLVPRLLAGELPVVLDHVVNVVDVRDVAEALLRMLDAGRYGAPTLVCGHNLSLEALARWVCERGGGRPPRATLDAGLGMLMALGAERLLAGTGAARAWPALGPMLLCEHTWMTPDPAQRALGLAPRPLSATLADSIAWYRRIGYC